MRILLLHLSDIHIQDSHDGVLARAGRIVAAVRDIDHRIDACILALTGDVGFSGKAEQYELAQEWLRLLRENLSEVYAGSVPIHLAAVPGNHDCDFSESSSARTSLIESMARDVRVVEDPASAVACTHLQQPFFTFRDRVASVNLTDAASRVYYEYRIPIKDESLLLKCCNTAWVSQLTENPAKLNFPEGLISIAPAADGGPRDSLVITLMHHTYNWMVPGSIRGVRRRLQSVSDFILTGHEHEFGLSQTRDENGGTAVYVEGLALETHGNVALKTGFNAILIDTTQRAFRVVPFTWTSGRYSEDVGAQCANWTPFAINPLRAGHVFRIKPSMVQRLQDAELTLLHPTRGQLTLDDIFVYPDLREIAANPVSTAHLRVLNAQELLKIAEGADRICITGGKETGKSTLAKRLFMDALDIGLVPLLIDGGSSRLRGDERDRKELVRIFEDQYDASGEDYLDLTREKRLVIIDDVSRVRTDRTVPREVVEYISHFAGRVVVFSDDVAQLVQEITGLAPLASGRTPFLHYGILPLGHVRREEMIDRYVGFASNGDPIQAEELRADMRSILGMAVGKYFAPPTPVTVISILQARAFNEQLNLHHSTYGYYYELLIKRQLLAQETSVQDLDIKLAYLTELAYAVFRAGQNKWSEGWMIEFHQRFIKERKLHLGFRNIIDSLVANGVLRGNLVTYEFRHVYIYYYFVGRALAERLPTVAGREQIADLTRTLHTQDSASILLFLTHHSKDAAIIDPMLLQAESLFADWGRADLTPGSTALPNLEEALKDAVFIDRPIDEQRLTYLSKLDELETGRSSRPSAPQSSSSLSPTERADRDRAVQQAVDVLTRISVSFRTMQILGQLLKNFPGTLTGEQKERITRAVYGVSLRTLGFIHRLFQDYTEVVASQVVDAIRNEHPDLSRDEVTEAARTVVAWHIYLASYGMTQRTAANVGSPLLDPVFEEVLRSDPVPAIKLITVALKLERCGTFPENTVRELYEEFENNPLARRVLRGLVVAHFHMFDVPSALKQSLCALMRIVYTPHHATSGIIDLV